jgi:hypothetical protein
MVTGVPVQVERCTFYPRGSDSSTATYLVIHYRLLQGVSLRAAGALENGRIICYHLGWHVGEPSLSPARRCPE